MGRVSAPSASFEPTYAGIIDTTNLGTTSGGSNTATDMTTIYSEVAYIANAALILIKTYATELTAAPKTLSMSMASVKSGLLSAGKTAFGDATTATDYLRQVNDAITMLNYYGTTYPNDATIAGYIKQVKDALAAVTGSTVDMTTIYPKVLFATNAILALIKAYTAATGTTATNYLKLINAAAPAFAYYVITYPKDTTIAGYAKQITAALTAAKLKVDSTGKVVADTSTPGTIIVTPVITTPITTAKTPMSTGTKITIGVVATGAGLFLLSRLL